MVFQSGKLPDITSKKRPKIKSLIVLKAFAKIVIQNQKRLVLCSKPLASEWNFKKQEFGFSVKTNSITKNNTPTFISPNPTKSTFFLAISWSERNQTDTFEITRRWDLIHSSNLANHSGLFWFKKSVINLPIFSSGKRYQADYIIFSKLKKILHFFEPK